MTINEIKEKVTPLLPENWNIEYIDTEHGCMKLSCPLEDRFGKTSATFKENTEKIANTLGFKFDGGGAFIGGKRYDLFYFF